MLICKIEYLQFGTGRLISIRAGDMGVPRIGDEVIMPDETGYRTTRVVKKIEWYEDANSPRVFVYLE